MSARRFLFCLGLLTALIAAAFLRAETKPVAPASAPRLDSDCCAVHLSETGGTFAVHMSPNPSEGLFSINVSGVNNQHVRITVTDNTGKSVYTNEFLSAEPTVKKLIDITTLPKGIYFVRVENDSQFRINKMIIN